MYTHSTRMRLTQLATWLVGLHLLMGATSAIAQLPNKVGETPVPSLAPMIKKASPAVVFIAAKGTTHESNGGGNPAFADPRLRRLLGLPEQEPQDRPFMSGGSGVIVDAKNGYILTGAHVIENASEITVTLLDNRSFKALLVGTDKGSDVAVLKIKGNNLVEMPIADSSKAEVGDFVVAIGNPFGLEHTVTSGIISALGRTNIGPSNREASYEDLIQTDASINQGNSGGALVNLSGQLLGINSRILNPDGAVNIGIGFAIPSNMAKSIMDQLIKYGEVKRGLLGVKLLTLTPAVAESYGLPAETRGALIAEVINGSAAAKAGIEPEDIVIAVNGKTIKTDSELRNTIGLMRIGDKVDLTVLRDGKQRHLVANVGDNNKSKEIASAANDSPVSIHSGFEGADLVNNSDKGVLVRNVKPGTPAADNGLQPNDVIIAIGRTRINNLDQLRTATANKSAFGIRIKRGGAEIVGVIE